jgi:hypothetical protein
LAQRSRRLSRLGSARPAKKRSRHSWLRKVFLEIAGIDSGNIPAKSTIVAEQ